MRLFIIERLKTVIMESDGFGIPRYFNCTDKENITDVEEVHQLTDDQLLDIYNTIIEFCK